MITAPAVYVSSAVVNLEKPTDTADTDRRRGLMTSGTYPPAHVHPARTTDGRTAAQGAGLSEKPRHTAQRTGKDGGNADTPTTPNRATARGCVYV